MGKNILEIKDPKRLMLFRCSSDTQNYEGQRDIMQRYFKQHDIDSSGFSVGMEYEHRDTAFEQRLIAEVLYKFKEGTIIYVSELSRLGCDLRDVFEICDQCYKKGITIIQCKDGQEIESRSLQGKMLLFALSIGADIELQNIRTRAISGTKRCLRDLKEQGYYIDRRGQKKYKWGNSKGVDTSKATAASNVATKFNAKVWKEESALYDFVQTLTEAGMPAKEIVRKCQEMYEKAPELYSTRQGKPLNIANYYRMKQQMIVQVMVD